MIKENQRLGDSYGKLVESSREEARRLETELRLKSQEGDTIAKETITLSHRS